MYDLADHEALRREIASSYLLANATGMGMKPLEGKTWLPDKSYLRPDLIVTDTVYAPAETEFLRIAKEVGCKNMNGFGMMLFQGAAGFKMWTGQDMPIEHMKEVLGIKYGD
jgi:shikimate dehydrogenase